MISDADLVQNVKYSLMLSSIYRASSCLEAYLFVELQIYRY